MVKIYFDPADSADAELMIFEAFRLLEIARKLLRVKRPRNDVHLNLIPGSAESPGSCGILGVALLEDSARVFTRKIGDGMKIVKLNPRKYEKNRYPFLEVTI